MKKTGYNNDHQRENVWSLIKFFQVVLWRNVWRLVWRICLYILVLQELRHHFRCFCSKRKNKPKLTKDTNYTCSSSSSIRLWRKVHKHKLSSIRSDLSIPFTVKQKNEYDKTAACISWQPTTSVNFIIMMMWWVKLCFY